LRKALGGLGTLNKQLVTVAGAAISDPEQRTVSIKEHQMAYRYYWEAGNLTSA
jgi:hypothetical protein